MDDWQGYMDRRLKRDGRIIGLLVLIIGFVLFVAGVSTVQTSEYVIKRYEDPGGTLLRIVSEEDERNYQNAKDAVGFGGGIALIGLLTMVAGLIVIIRPGIYRWFERRIFRRDRERERRLREGTRYRPR
jgi:hypothetical protein